MSEQTDTTILLTAPAVGMAVTTLAQEIVNAHEGLEEVALLGILSRGRPLADRLAAAIESLTNCSVPVGSLSTVLYRDDLRSGRRVAKFGGGETHFDFDVTDKTILLIDDVFATGRTTRAALDEVMDYGRPHRIELACLVDTGVRELPIRPDYTGWNLAANPNDHVTVHLEEVDGEDVVYLEHATPAVAEGEG